MGKQYLTHCLLMLVLILAGCISAEHYYIVADNSISQCKNYTTGTCFTLAELAPNINHLDEDNNLTLSFLPGEHLLTRRLTITGPKNIALTGKNTSNSSMYAIKCQGTSGFEFENIESLNIVYLEFTGCGNVTNGGAISITWANTVFIRGCHFINNHVRGITSTSAGGAICAEKIMAMKIESSFFKNNSAIGNGLRYGIVSGGAISVSTGAIFSINSQYIKNRAFYGGAIYVELGNISSTNNQYINNSADYVGGAIKVLCGSITSTSDHYTNNSAGFGGAISVSTGNISSISNQYTQNTATNGRGGGGAIDALDCSINSTSDQYINNNADHNGGAILMEDSGSCNLCNDSFKNNTAVEGAVIHKLKGILEIVQSNITGNFASKRGNLYLDTVTVVIAEGVNIVNNRGSLYVSSTKVQIIGTVAFMNNSGDFGGAITAIQQSQIIFNTASMVTISNNTATYGGGIYLTQGTLQVYHPIMLVENKASVYGGGIYASRSKIDFTSEQTQTLATKILNNTAHHGGALCAIASNIHISNTSVDFISNTAIMNGGAMYLGQNTKIVLHKYKLDCVQDDHLNTRLDLTNNSAEKGGAIYVADNNNIGVLCHGASTEINQEECFIQTVQSYEYFSPSSTYINTFFINNTAYQSGSDIYGGLLDRCTINPGAELFKWFPEYTTAFGFDYIKATTQIEQIIDYTPYAKSHPHYLINVISKSDVVGLISSHGILSFCLDNVVSPNYSHPNVLIIKGELFTVSVAVVDQVENLVNATVVSSMSSESGNGHFKGGQVEQQVGNQCTELEYNVYSQDNSTQVHIYLYTDDPCGNIEISKLTLNLKFLPCECPVGFQPSSSQTECICVCDRRLKLEKITSCFSEKGTIQVETKIWIGVTNSTNGTGFVIHDCPYDYCVQTPVNISLGSINGTDKQCAYNRTGILCGMCQEDLSLVFASSRCIECSDYYVFQLIPFALAGIALVAFILLLNMTVATGTIHGLIFYANILKANHSLFLPFANPNFLTVFISWLNLDLGIEVCFYNGMDSYSKFLLQLAFPTYVFVLIGTIIALCEVSKKFATLLGKRNPVAALCTLILLSYSKLIRTIITALQFTNLDYPDGSREIVWLYDANIPYFTVSHIPRFIAAFVIFILGAVYIILLLFGQWFPLCSNRKLMKWAKNTKYNAFIDAYHAPFTPKHRYWIGLLLFAQTTQNIVAAMATETTAPILSAGCVALGLILLKLLNTGIYRNKLQDSLETLFLINLAVLTNATFYNRETNEGQLALANTSMAISFILFLVILGYHFYKYILKGTRVWSRVSQRKELVLNRRHLYQLPPLEDEEPKINQDTLDIDNQLREPALDILDPVYTEDYRVTPPPPVVHKPPKITYTVIDAIPRQRDRVPCGPAGKRK